MAAVKHNLSPLHVAVIGCSALAVAMGIGRFAFTPILPMMQVDSGLTLSEAGWLASANYLGYLAGAVLAIGIPWRAGRVLPVSLVIIVFTTAAMGLVHDYMAWLVLRALAGVASAWALVFGSAWALKWLAWTNRPELTGVVFAGVGLGTALAGAGCVLFMYWSWSADQAWLALAALAVLLSLPAAWRLQEPADALAEAAEPPALPGRRPTGRQLAPILSYGLFGFGYIIPATFLPAMARQLIAEPVVFGWAWPLFGAAAFLSTMWVSRLRHGPANRTIWMTSQCVLALGVIMPLILPGIIGVGVSALLVGATFMVITMTAMREARIIDHRAPAKLMASMTTAFALGQILGPAMVGLRGAHAAAFEFPLAVAAGALLTGALLLWAGPANGRR